MKNMELKDKFLEQIFDVADKSIKKPLPILTEELFAQFEQTGNRVNYENVYFERRKMLVTIGMASILNGNKAYLNKLEEIVLDICTEETWALPAHVNRGNSDWRNTVDLFACETVAALAVIVYKCSSGLSQDVINLVLNEIKRRVITPIFVDNREYGWQKSKDNWNAVCNGSLGIAVIVLNKLLFEDSKDILRALEQINKSLVNYIDGFPMDGCCLEGMGYYNYGLSYFTSYADRLYTFSNGKMNLFQNHKFRKIAEFPSRIFFENGKCVNFSDASANEKVHYSIISKLAKHCGTVANLPEEWLADFEYDKCYRFNVIYEDYIAIQNRDDSDYQRMEIRILPDAQWVVAESVNGVSFAIKGGNNDEPHNHNDIGSFIYSDNNFEIACDLGAGEYTKDYFSEKRYEVLYTSSLGHNVPLVDGKAQIPGKEAKAEEFKTWVNDRVLCVSMNISKAYATSGNILRQVTFNLDSGELEIADHYSNCHIQERIVSRNRIGDNIKVSPGYRKEETTKKIKNHEGNEEVAYIYTVSRKSEKNETTDNRDSSAGDQGTIVYRLHP